MSHLADAVDAVPALSAQEAVSCQAVAGNKSFAASPAQDDSVRDRTGSRNLEDVGRGSVQAVSGSKSFVASSAQEDSVRDLTGSSKSEDDIPLSIGSASDLMRHFLLKTI